MTKKEKQPEEERDTDQKKLEVNDLEPRKDTKGGPSRSQTDFGDPIGNYNFKVEIDGVDASNPAQISPRKKG